MNSNEINIRKEYNKTNNEATYTTYYRNQTTDIEFSGENRN